MRPRCGLVSCRRCSAWCFASALGSCTAASTSLEVVHDEAGCRSAASIPRSWVGDISDHREALLASMPCMRAAEMRRSSYMLCVSRWSQCMWHSSRCRHCRGVRRCMALSSRTGAFPWRFVPHSSSRGRRCFDEFPRGLSLWCTPRSRSSLNLPVRMALVAAVKERREVHQAYDRNANIQSRS